MTATLPPRPNLSPLGEAAAAAALAGIDPAPADTNGGQPHAGGDGGDHYGSSFSADDESSSWTPIDLTPYLDGTVTRPEPGVLFRDDGIGLLYPGKVHWDHGESESGKSWVAQIAVVAVIRAGGRVLYLDHESDPGEITARLLALGADPADIASHLVYVRPDDSSMTARNATVWDRLLSERFDLAVVDGVTDALGLDKASSTDTDDVAAWMRRMPRRIAASTGAAVLATDHVTKDSDSRGRFAIGSQHKLAGVDGAAFVVEPSQPLGEGLVGEIVLRIAKDRPGSLRRHGGTYRKTDRTQEIARIMFDSTDPKHIQITISAPASVTGAAGASGGFRPTTLMSKISRVLDQHPDGLTSTRLLELVKGNKEYLRKALDVLVDEGYVQRVEQRRGAATTYTHRLLRPFSELADPVENQGFG
jgi:AAA domain